jgi:hypothetical protein
MVYVAPAVTVGGPPPMARISRAPYIRTAHRKTGGPFWVLGRIHPQGIANESDAANQPPHETMIGQAFLLKCVITFPTVDRTP